MERLSSQPEVKTREENDSKKPTSLFVNPQEVVYFSNRFHTTAVLPVFPPGVLSLLGALLVLFGIGFLTYVAIAQGDGLNERMDAAAIALNNMIHRLWHGEISSLNLLVVHPDIRSCAGMYLGAIVAALGIYIGYVMDKPSFVTSFPDPSTLLAIPSRERLMEEMMAGLQKISSINGISCEPTRTSTDAECAPTPALSVSSILTVVGRGIRWMLRGRTRKELSPTNRHGKETANLHDRVRNEPIPRSPSSSWRDTMTATIDAAADEGRARLQTLTLFLSSSGPRYRALTAIQRLDVTAGVTLVLALLFWAVLHAGNIQHMGSHLTPYLPYLGAIICTIGCLRVLLFLIDLVIKKLRR